MTYGKLNKKVRNIKYSPQTRYAQNGRLLIVCKIKNLYHCLLKASTSAISQEFESQRTS